LIAASAINDTPTATTAFDVRKSLSDLAGAFGRRETKLLSKFTPPFDMKLLRVDIRPPPWLRWAGGRAHATFRAMRLACLLVRAPLPLRGGTNVLSVLDRSRRENIIYTHKVNKYCHPEGDETAADGRENPRISGCLERV
jgi:hypothetical protein